MGSDGIVPSNMEDLLEGGGTLGRLLREECGSMVDAIAKLVHQTGGAVLEPRADGASLLHRLALMGLYEGVKTLWERGAKPSILSSDDSTLLHSAVRAGDSSQDEQRAKILSLFLGGSRHDASLPVDKRNNKGWTALKLAARKGLERSVETLLEYGADPNIPDYENYLPLHNSVCHHAILKLLVSSRHRQSINAQTQNGETPLYLAAESGNVESAVTLLEHQADPNITNREGVSPLFLAARGGNADLVRVLLKNNSHVNITGGSQHIAPLHWAAHKEFTEIALLLIEYGADVQLRDKEGRTAIGLASPELAAKMLEVARRRNPHIAMSPLRGETVITTEEKAVSACCSGNKQALQSLLQAGLNANLTKDGTSTTLLHLGAYCGQPGIVSLLLNNGADWQLRDKDGDTVLHYACMKKGQGSHDSTLSYLLSTPCVTLINTQNSRSDTPLLVSIRCGCFERMQILLKYNADSTIRNAKNELPLHRACCGDNNIGIVLQLAEMLTDLDIKDIDGWTPLMFAARSKSPAIVHYLLQRGVDPNRQQSVGFTALHLAVQENQLEISQLLLKYKANPNIPGGPQCLTPLHIASHKSFREICWLLAENGADIGMEDKDSDTPLTLTNDPAIKEAITNAHGTYADRMRERSNSHPTTPPPCALYSLFRRDSKKEEGREGNCCCHEDMVTEKEECLEALVIKLKTLQSENELLHSRLGACQDELKQRELSDKVCGLQLWDGEEEEGEEKDEGAKNGSGLSKPWWLVGEHEVKMAEEPMNVYWEHFQRFYNVHLGTFRSIDVVVKKINRPQEAWECCTRRTFHKEVEQLSRLQCPYVVQFMGAIAVQSSGLYCLIMEYMPNGDLHSLMHLKKTQLTQMDKLHIIRDIATGMAYLHSFPIIHRNLIPSNVLIGENMNAKVSDFGFYETKVQTNFYADLRKHCLKDGNKRPYYRAPEIIERNEFSAASDVYSFGIMLHEVITEKRPFADVDPCTNAMVWVMKLLMGTRPPLPQELEPSCKQMISRCWHQDPSMRPSFKEFLVHCEEKVRESTQKATATE